MKVMDAGQYPVERQASPPGLSDVDGETPVAPSCMVPEDQGQRGPFQNPFAESSKIVTGPSLTSSTCIVSWKHPVSQRRPAARTFSTKYS